MAQRETFIPQATHGRCRVRAPISRPVRTASGATLRMKTMWARWWNSRMEHAVLSRSDRAIKGPKCQMAFELNGREGALSWDFERMNELSLMLSEEDPGERRVSADSVRTATSVPPEF